MIGRTLGSYRIVEQIGMGGMATVYKAYEAATDRYVALKVLPEQYSRDPKFLQRFNREARALARLEHIHILPIFAYGQEEGITYLVMRYMPTGTLTERIKQGGPMPLREASRLLTQIAGALDYAHRNGILHRDVKPSNVLLDADDNAYLTDFGIARMVEGTLDLTGGNLLGTPAYMSPEQCMGSTDLTTASDQYALGVVLYEMVTGRTPFQAETPIALIHMQLTAPLPPPSAFRPDLPEDAERVLLKALARKPETRFDTCTAMAESFARALEGVPLELPSPPAPPDALTIDMLPSTAPGAATAPAVPAPPQQGMPVWLWPVIALAGIGIVALALFFGLRGAQIVVGGRGAAAEPTSAAAGAAESLAPSTPIPLPVVGDMGAGRIVSPCGEGYLCVESQSGERTEIPLGRSFAAIEGLSWSPDGAQVVFGGCPSENYDAQMKCLNLYIVDVATGELVELIVDYATGEKLPAWSPSGEWIAFHQECGLNVIHPDGSGLRRLTEGGPIQWCAELMAWSPDSQQIAWIGGNGLADSPEHSNRLYVINVDGTGFRKVFDLGDTQFISSGGDGRLAWSPDGSTLVSMTRSGEVYQIDIACDADTNPCDPSSLPRLETFPIHWMHTFYPQWGGEAVSAAPGPVSPGGPAPAEPVSPGEPPPGAVAVNVCDGHTLCLEPLAGGTPTTLLKELGLSMLGASTAWSPDGRQIVFAASQEGNSASLYIVNADGSGLTPLPPRCNELDASWSPDGQWLAFHSCGALVLMHPDGSGAVELDNRCVLDPEWSPDSRSIVASVVTDGGCAESMPYTRDVRVILVADGSAVTLVTMTHALGGARANLVAFSPDGQHVAYTDPDGQNWLIPVDGSGSPIPLTTFPFWWASHVFPQWGE
jgi:tRNA A-37 threonylcarbamoyl transferase component Bud32/WD40 repeat protein